MVIIVGSWAGFYLPTTNNLLVKIGASVFRGGKINYYLFFPVMAGKAAYFDPLGSVIRRFDLPGGGLDGQKCCGASELFGAGEKFYRNK